MVEDGRGWNVVFVEGRRGSVDGGGRNVKEQFRDVEKLFRWVVSDKNVVSWRRLNDIETLY